MDGSATAQAHVAASTGGPPDATQSASRTETGTGAGTGAGTDSSSGNSTASGTATTLMRVVRALRAHPVPAALAAVVVLVQISYPLLDGDALRAATVAAVLGFAATSVVHAAVTRGVLTGVAVLVVAGGIGLLAETVGVRTGYPFGEYAYTDTLGAKALGVPVVVPLAWTMMAWPCLLLGRRTAALITARIAARSTAPVAGRTEAAVRRLAVAATGGFGLAAWDLYLDPQMVAAGHWTWRFPEPALPGVPGIPLTNYAGWLLVAFAMVAALDAVVPARRPDGGSGPADEAVPAALLAWTWLGSGLANLAFFGRPAVAAYGLVAMGVVVGPYLADLLRALRSSRGTASR